MTPIWRGSLPTQKQAEEPEICMIQHLENPAALIYKSCKPMSLLKPLRECQRCRGLCSLKALKVLQGPHPDLLESVGL